MDLADGAEAVVAMAVADVIVVRADQDHLVLELGIAALDHPQQVAEAVAEILDVAAIVAGFREPNSGISLSR